MAQALTTPETIRVERTGKTARLIINGEEFPHHIAREPIEVTIDPDSPLRTVRLTLLAEHVEVIDLPQAEDDQA